MAQILVNKKRHGYPHSKDRRSCKHCTHRGHDHVSGTGDSCRFHSATEGKCVYYKSHPHYRKPRYYSKCVAVSSSSKKGKIKRKRSR